MKTTKIALIIFVSVLLFVGCTDSSDKTTNIAFDKSSDSYKIKKGGSYVFSGELYDGQIEVNTKKNVTIVLSGVTINCDEEAINIEKAGSVDIITQKGTENYISGGGDAAIKSACSIGLHGEGDLYITSAKAHGIECEGDITINGGGLNVNSYEHGIKSESVIKVLGGSVTINSQTGKGIKAEKEYLGEGGSIYINTPENEGLESKGALTINAGNYSIVAGDDGINAGTSDSAEESSDNSPTNATPDEAQGTGANAPSVAQPDQFRPGGGFPADGKGEPMNRHENAPAKGQWKERPVPPEIPEEEIPPSDFEAPEGATSSGRGIPFSHESGGGFGRINKDSVININGGTIYIQTDCDGIDSNGSLAINGGTVIIDGPEGGSDGPLDCDGEMIIEGATVAMASAIGMLQLPRTMNQGVLNISFKSPLSINDEIGIYDIEGNEIFTHKVKKNCESFVFTSPEIKNGTEYIVKANGAEFTRISSTIDFKEDFMKNETDNLTLA